MKVATGTRIVGGISIGKLRVYKPPVYEINEGLIEDPIPELNRFESARIKVQQQHALYEKAVKEAGKITYGLKSWGRKSNGGLQ